MRPRGNFTRIKAPRLFPVASAIRSQISCAAIINGNVNGTVHSIPYE